MYNYACKCISIADKIRPIKFKIYYVSLNQKGERRNDRSNRLKIQFWFQFISKLSILFYTIITFNFKYHDSPELKKKIKRILKEEAKNFNFSDLTFNFSKINKCNFLHSTILSIEPGIAFYHEIKQKASGLETINYVYSFIKVAYRIQQSSRLNVFTHAPDTATGSCPTWWLMHQAINYQLCCYLFVLDSQAQLIVSLCTIEFPQCVYLPLLIAVFPSLFPPFVSISLHRFLLSTTLNISMHRNANARYRGLPPLGKFFLCKKRSTPRLMIKLRTVLSNYKFI